MRCILEVKNLTKSYGNVEILKGINFCIKEGEFVALLGVNGAGKTSLISSIAGNVKFSGLIKINGFDVVHQEYNAKINLGVVPQELAFDPFFNVYETLVYTSGIYGVRNNRIWLDEILERLHLYDQRNKNVRSLSGGMKRRLLVAQALVHKPRMIILDEPTVGVDVELRKDLLQFFVELNQNGFTILLTSHYLDELEELCKHVIIIDQGQIIANTSINNLIHDLNYLHDIIIISDHELFAMKLKDFIINQVDYTYNLRLRTIEDLYTIFDILRNSNISIKLSNIMIHKPSLEDAFLKFVGRKNK